MLEKAKYIVKLLKRVEALKQMSGATNSQVEKLVQDNFEHFRGEGSGENWTEYYWASDRHTIKVIGKVIGPDREHDFEFYVKEKGSEDWAVFDPMSLAGALEDRVRVFNAAIKDAASKLIVSEIATRNSYMADRLYTCLGQVFDIPTWEELSAGDEEILSQYECDVRKYMGRNEYDIITATSGREINVDFTSFDTGSYRKHVSVYFGDSRRAAFEVLTAATKANLYDLEITLVDGKERSVKSLRDILDVAAFTHLMAAASEKAWEEEA